jgi:hypothetical protein
MKTQNFIDQYNAALAPERPAQDESADFQTAYLAKLLDCEQQFDELTARRKVVSESSDEESFQPVIFKAVNMGNYILGGSVKAVVAQPSRRLSYRGVTGKDRIGRKIELFSPEEDVLAAIDRIPLRVRRDLLIGSVNLDSSRTRAIPSSVGLLENFSELLNEVSIRAKNEDASA